MRNNYLRCRPFLLLARSFLNYRVGVIVLYLVSLLITLTSMQLWFDYQIRFDTQKQEAALTYGSYRLVLSGLFKSEVNWIKQQYPQQNVSIYSEDKTAKDAISTVIEGSIVAIAADDNFLRLGNLEVISGDFNKLKCMIDESFLTQIFMNSILDDNEFIKTDSPAPFPKDLLNAYPHLRDYGLFKVLTESPDSGLANPGFILSHIDNLKTGIDTRYFIMIQPNESDFYTEGKRLETILNNNRTEPITVAYNYEYLAAAGLSETGENINPERYINNILIVLLIAAGIGSQITLFKIILERLVKSISIMNVLGIGKNRYRYAYCLSGLFICIIGKLTALLLSISISLFPIHLSGIFPLLLTAETVILAIGIFIVFELTGRRQDSLVRNPLHVYVQSESKRSSHTQNANLLFHGLHGAFFRIANRNLQASRSRARVMRILLVLCVVFLVCVTYVTSLFFGVATLKDRSIFSARLEFTYLDAYSQFTGGEYQHKAAEMLFASEYKNEFYPYYYTTNTITVPKTVISKGYRLQLSKVIPYFSDQYKNSAIHTFDLPLVIIGIRDEDMGRILPNNSFLHDGECLSLEYSYTESQGRYLLPLSTNDEVNINVITEEDSSHHSLKVVGIVDSFPVMTRETEHTSILFVNINTFTNLSANSDPNAIYLFPTEKSSLEKIKNFAISIPTVKWIDMHAERMEIETTAQRWKITTFRIGFAIMVVILANVFITIYMRYKLTAKELAVQHAMGLSNWQIGRIILYEVLLINWTAIFLSIVASISLTFMIYHVLLDQLPLFKPYTVPLTILLCSTGFIFFLSIVAWFVLFLYVKVGNSNIRVPE